MNDPRAEPPGASARSFARLTDRALAARAQAGSLPCFTELMERHQERVFNFLLRRTASAADAEDVAQETFVRAWRRIERYRPRWAFSTWLLTIAGRLASTHARRRPRAVAAGALEPPAPDRDDPARAVDDRDECRRLWALADRILGDAPRAALWLHVAEGLGARDIGRILGRSPVGVRVMLHRARQTLAAAAQPRAHGTPSPRPPAPAPLPGGVPTC